MRWVWIRLYYDIEINFELRDFSNISDERLARSSPSEFESLDEAPADLERQLSTGRYDYGRNINR